jgi:hypothetical protein
MTESTQVNTGTAYTLTLAFIVFAIGGPLAVIYFFQPVETFDLAVCAGLTGACAILAQIHGKDGSQLAMAATVTRRKTPN